jgi:hypothetical protein
VDAFKVHALANCHLIEAENLFYCQFWASLDCPLNVQRPHDKLNVGMNNQKLQFAECVHQTRLKTMPAQEAKLTSSLDLNSLLVTKADLHA